MAMNSKSGIQILAICLLLNACKTSNTPVSNVTQPAPQALIELGGNAYSAEDFVNSYNKNKFLADSANALQVTEYIDLYTNLKLKILDAVSEGRDTTSDFKQEIATYQQQLARPYLTNRESVEKMKREVYHRMQEELHVSHILTSVAQDASPEDTLKAFQATTAMIGRIKEGADFGDLAERFSADKASSVHRGDLGYFTAFQMVYPFENAAYNLKPGEISDPVRSRFGYHIIKLHERRPARGKIQVAHLMMLNDRKLAITE
jgi:peptidyl-prolyl cis-trans isomerase SurA